MAALAQRLGKLREGHRRALGQRLPTLAGTQPLRVRHRPLEPVACRAVRKIIERELVRLANAVRPVGADAEPHHVRDDQQWRVLQGQRVLPELAERRVEVGVFALVLPGKATALPDIGPAVATSVLPRTTLEAIVFAGRVGLRRCRLAQQPAQVDEVLLRRRTLLQFRRPPFGDERARRHRARGAGATGPQREPACPTERCTRCRSDPVLLRYLRQHAVTRG